MLRSTTKVPGKSQTKCQWAIDQGQHAVTDYYKKKKTLVTAAQLRRPSYCLIFNGCPQPAMDRIDRFTLVNLTTTQL